jgi:hypothetical protein
MWLRSSALGSVLLALLPLQTAQAQEATWRISAGHESFDFRDIAKNKPPVDGSPVVWRGDGPALTIDHTRRQPFRLHRFDLTVSSNGRFAYDLGVGESARPAGDHASFVSGQYDYRRYFGRSLWLSGLHGGVGVRGIGGRRSLRHNYGGAVELVETDVTGTIALVGAVRFTRFNRLDVEAEWTNGSTLAHGNQRHTGNVVSDFPSWGAGWFTEIAARADVRLWRRLGLLVWAGQDGEGLLFNHHSHSSTRARLMIGVTYAQ